jgi:hypothetical protein
MSLSNFAVTQGGGTDTVTTTMILDGTIANADVASDAAIDSSKINFANTLEIESSSGDQIFEMDNNASNSSNFQIQNGAGNARTDLYLDGSAVITLKNQMVGIGDTSPSYALDVNTTGRFTTDLIVGGNLTVGDGGAEDQKVVFNGNAQDFYVGLDDGTDDLIIGLGSAVGTTPAITINEDRDVTISDGAIDFDVASHDTSNGLKLGGTLVTSTAAELNLLDGKSSVGDASGPGSATDNAIARFNGTGGKTLQNSSTTIDDNGDIVVGGTTPKITIGDAGAEDTMLAFDGNAVDFRIGLDDGTDTLEIGVGTAHGTTTAISIDSSADMTLGGGIACADEVIGRPRFTDYAETKQAMAAHSVDLTLGNVQTYTLSGNQTLTFDNPSATGNTCSFTLVVTNGGSATLTWPGAVDWAGGDAPSLTSSGIDILTFMTMDAGTIWYGFAAGADMK